MHERQEMHKVGLDAVALHPLHPLVATAGADRLVKLWPYPKQVYQHCIISRQSLSGLLSDARGVDRR